MKVYEAEVEVDVEWMDDISLEYLELLAELHFAA